MGKRLIGSVGLKPGTDTGFDLDEKGQIHGYSDTQFALPVGDDNQVLSALASEASGLKWVTPSGGGIVEKLYDNTLTVTGSANTTQMEADFSSSPLTSTDYSHFEFWLTGLTAGGSMDLDLILDQSTANTYYYSGQQYGNTGTLTWTSASPSTTGTIADTTILDSSNDAFYCYGTCGFNPSRTSDFNVFTWLYQYSNGFSQFTRINGWSILSSASEISYIGIGATGTGSCDTGTRLQINGFKMT
jgi:hypothetical protein